MWPLVLVGLLAVAAEWLRTPTLGVAAVVGVIIIVGLIFLRGERGNAAGVARGALILLGLLVAW